MHSITVEFQEAFRHAKGYAHAASDEMSQGAVGINVMTREQMEKVRVYARDACVCACGIIRRHRRLPSLFQQFMVEAFASLFGS